jgi:hypothetical protein
VIPKTWDEEALADLEVPLVDPDYSPKDISADDYYRFPVRPIYKSYPKYHPNNLKCASSPPGYTDGPFLSGRRCFGELKCGPVPPAAYVITDPSIPNFQMPNLS